MSSLIYEVFSKCKLPDRDTKVETLMNHWMEKNARSLSNGIISDVPMFTKDVRNTLEECYNIKPEDIKEMNKSIDYERLKFRVNKNLKIGLVISWIDTREDLFLAFLSILVFSEIHRKYFPTFVGTTPKILERVIDDSDNRTDFKKYQKSLLMVVNKRIENGIRQWMTNKFKSGKPTDHDVIEAITSIDARYNGMMRILAQNTYAYIEKGVIVQTVQSTDTNDNHVLSSSSELATVSEAVREDLSYPSARIMGYIYQNNKESLAFEKYYNGIKMKKLGSDVVDYIDKKVGTKTKTEWMDVLSKLSLTKSSEAVANGIVDITDEIANKSDVTLNKRILLDIVTKYVAVTVMYRISRLGKEDE